jgi:hypothetical protein
MGMPHYRMDRPFVWLASRREPPDAGEKAILTT